MKSFFVTILTLTVVQLTADSGVESNYTIMRPISGLGLGEDSNFWIPSYEGADPKLVELSNPHHCGTDAQGRVYIVDKESHSILQISADGSTLTTVAGLLSHQAGDGPDTPNPATSTALSDPNGLFVFAHGSFLILDTGNSKIRKVSADGSCLTLINYPAGFGAGRGLTATPDGETIYFCGETNGSFQLVKKWTAADNNITTLTSDIPHGERGLGNLAIAPDGSLLVTSVGAHRVYRVNQAGESVIIAGNGLEDGNILSGSLATDVSLNRVRGVAVLPDGSYFLATQKGGDIWWVDQASKRIHLFVNGASSGNAKPTDGQPRLGAVDRIAEPRAIHLATNGDLLIISNDTGVVSAVRFTCPTAPPEPAFKDQTMSWPSNWGETVLIESSNSLSGPWSPIHGQTAGDPGSQSFDIPVTSGKQFFRLRSPEFAAGN